MLDKRSDGTHVSQGMEGIDGPDNDTDIPPADDGSERLPF